MVHRFSPSPYASRLVLEDRPLLSFVKIDKIDNYIPRDDHPSNNIGY
jgi:hypothetical protein